MAKKKAAPKTKTPKAAPETAPETTKPESDGVVGRTIRSARPMTADEMNSEGWETGNHALPTVLVLDDGSKLYPSRDEEGNGPGVLFGRDKDGQTFVLCEA